MGATLFVEAADVVGESAVYDDQRGALLWVDIAGKRIHRVLLGEKRHEVWPAPDFPTSIGLRADGGAILGLRDRVVLWDLWRGLPYVCGHRARPARQPP
jgi:sugar lactone lactonase YvrE